MSTVAAATVPAAAATPTAWEGRGSQADFMARDNCIVVDGADAIVGSANKYDCHRFVEGQPSGRLHRAFSVFLFDSSNRLLLQQRAEDKITFPGVWTNTCCSHQLVGQTPEEVDSDGDIAAGRAPGAEAAARRKLLHELGIDPAAVPPLRYLTRLHYCARDAGTHGPAAPWGEHEVDYILVGRSPPGQELALAPNPEEVGGVRYVTAAELAAMMDPGSGLKWSPWFRIIASHFLPTWWADLDAVLAEGKHVDAATIHRIDC
ncbi:MAG: NUDIX hydrolase domain-like protein [Monoraphidium minutum]|nr:MAG: NUDIX hydrolase domain-like protein [Monoraphidium minutum]